MKCVYIRSAMAIVLLTIELSENKLRIPLQQNHSHNLQFQFILKSRTS